MRWTTEELRNWVASLPDRDKANIIYDMAWTLFGDFDDDGKEYIDPTHKPSSPDLKGAVIYLRGELTRERSELTVKEVIRTDELEIERGHTIAEIVELAGACLDRANSWDICGEVLFIGDDDRYYVGTVEFVIAPANPAYVEQALGEDRDDQGGDDEETE